MAGIFGLPTLQENLDQRAKEELERRAFQSIASFRAQQAKAKALKGQLAGAEADVLSEQQDILAEEPGLGALGQIKLPEAIAQEASTLPPPETQASAIRPAGQALQSLRGQIEQSPIERQQSLSKLGTDFPENKSVQALLAEEEEADIVQAGLEYAETIRGTDPDMASKIEVLVKTSPKQFANLLSQTGIIARSQEKAETLLGIKGEQAEKKLFTQQEFKAEQDAIDRGHDFSLALYKNNLTVDKLILQNELKFTADEHKRLAKAAQSDDAANDAITLLEILAERAPATAEGPAAILHGTFKWLKQVAKLAPNEKALQAASGLLAGQFAKKIGGESGKLTDQDRMFALALMPNKFDDIEVRRQKMAILASFKVKGLSKDQMRQMLRGGVAQLGLTEEVESTFDSIDRQRDKFGLADNETLIDYNPNASRSSSLTIKTQTPVILPKPQPPIPGAETAAPLPGAGDTGAEPTTTLTDEEAFELLKQRRLQKQGVR